MILIVSEVAFCVADHLYVFMLLLGLRTFFIICVLPLVKQISRTRSVWYVAEKEMLKTWHVVIE